MATPFLAGPYPLTDNGVNSAVTTTSAGVYALGRLINGIFQIGYVGRSDDDVNRRLHDHVKLPDPEFRFAYCGSAQAAFLAECELWHAYGGVRNPIHPARPKGAYYKCPVAGCTSLI